MKLLESLREEYSELVETFINGNITDFKQAIKDMNEDDIIGFSWYLMEDNGTFYPKSTVIRIFYTALRACKED